MLSHATKRLTGRGGNLTLKAISRAFIAVLLLLGASSIADAQQLSSRPGAVVLVARISDQVGVKWGASPVTHLLREAELLPQGETKHTGHLFVFENSLHLGMGNVVSGETLLDAPDGRAEMLALGPSTTNSEAPAWSLLQATQPKPQSWTSGDPRKGRQELTQACLIVTEEGAAPTVRVRLTAL